MSKLVPVEHQNQRILTTQQIAEYYEVDVQKIQQNYVNNKERYIDGKHFYLLQGEELKQFKNYFENFEVVNKKAPTLYLWTEKGAFLHAKSLNTDKAWEAYDMLVDTYFVAKEMAKALPKPENDRLKIQDMNAKTRLANMFLKLSKVDTLSKEYKNILVNKATEVLIGTPLLPMTKSEQKTYSATDIGKMFGISAHKVGSIAKKNGLKTEPYGEWYRDKSRYASKEVDSFRYFDAVIGKFKELLGI